MLDALLWVAAVDVADPTTGGFDAETPDDYTDKLANLLPAVALRPILPQDFAVLALQLVPGVGRAVVMNLYDPPSGTWNNARTVTLMLTQADGTPCPQTVKDQVAAMLESLREVNWVVNIIDPTYQTIAVAYTVTAYSGQDPAAVQASCDTAITSYLQPSNFRLGQLSPAIAGGEVIFPPATGQPAQMQVIRINELVALLDRTLGVDFVGPVTIQGVAADYQLPHPYSLPEPGVITGEVLGGA
jgi:uncharacterized phage protein gp47/JayE